MMKGMTEMSATAAAIEKIINTPLKTNMTKTEAVDILKQCGIFNNNAELEEAYLDIIVPKPQRCKTAMTSPLQKGDRYESN